MSGWVAEMRRSCEKMFGSDTTARQSTRQVPYPIEISQSEMRRFHALNPDEAEVRDRAERIRVTHAELREFPSDEVVVIKTKHDHLKGIERVLNTGANIINVVALVGGVKSEMLYTTTNTVKDSKSDMAQYIVRHVEPDYSPEDIEGKSEEKKVVVAGEKSIGVATVLKSFKVPEGIATDVDCIYEKGPSGPAILSLVTHLATKYFTGEEEAPNADNFDFSTDTETKG